MPLDEGTISVTVVRARGLQKMDVVGSADPFIVLRCAGRDGKERSHKTKTVKNSLAPSWDATFSFDVVGDATVLMVEMYDWDRLSSNDPMSLWIPVRSTLH